MRTIWEFEFKIEDKVEIDMPAGAEVLSVGSQRPEYICVWALCEPATLPSSRTFYVRGTGHPLGKELRYLHADDELGGLPEFLGTVTDGKFFWHVFGHVFGCR